MSPPVSNEVVAEQIKNLAISMDKVEKQIDQVSTSMGQFIEFRKEAEFLNQKISKLEGARNKLFDDVRDLSLQVNSQKTLNRVIQFIVGIAASAALSIGIFIAGSSGKTDSILAGLDKDITLLKFQISQISKQPQVQVNNNDEKKN